MCVRKSKLGTRGIAIGFFLCLLLASPLYAASYWGGLFLGDSEKGSPIVSQNQGLAVLQVESSQETPTESLPTFDEKALKSLQKDLEALQKTQQSLDERATKLENSATVFLEQSKRSLEAGEITDAQYEEMRATAVAMSSANAEQADRIAELEKAASSRPYVKAGLDIGFNDLIPTYGVDAAIGVRIGNHLMVEAGAGYTIGEFVGEPIYDFSMDNLSFNASVGWMF